MYAQEQAQTAGLACKYLQQDIRTADYGDGYGLVMSIFGEFNVFRTEDVKGILVKTCRALVPDGLLLLEPHSFEKVVELGQHPASWYATEKGLFLDKPHLYLQENFWDAENKVAIQRYYIIEAATGKVTCNSSSTQAYTKDEYRALLTECGFGDIIFHPTLGKSSDSMQHNLLCILARKVVAS
jgi:hypothetical protein